MSFALLAGGQRQQQHNIRSFTDHRRQPTVGAGFVIFTLLPHGGFARVNRLLDTVVAADQALPVDNSEDLLPCRGMTADPPARPQAKNGNKGRVFDQWRHGEGPALESCIPITGFGAAVNDPHTGRLTGTPVHSPECIASCFRPNYVMEKPAVLGDVGDPSRLRVLDLGSLREYEPDPARFQGDADELARRRRVPLFLLLNCRAVAVEDTSVSCRGQR